MKSRTKEQNGCHVDKWELEELVRKHFEAQGKVVDYIDEDYEYPMYDDDRIWNGFNVKFK